MEKQQLVKQSKTKQIIRKIAPIKTKMLKYNCEKTGSAEVYLTVKKMLMGRTNVMPGSGEHE